MQSRSFQQVDVFTRQAYRGNPVAVVLDASDLSTEAMQAFTDWTNLSEATFVLPPTPQGREAGADYRVRIFCPGHELPFAGHPTLGTCHAWLQAGGKPQVPGKIVQECGVGLVTLRQQGGALAFAAPPRRKSDPLDEEDVLRIAAALQLERSDIVAHAWCDNGPPWRGLLLRSAQQLLAVEPRAEALAGMDIGLIAPLHDTGASSPPSDGAPDFEVRAFFHVNKGLIEDPVTGSLNAALGQWLIGAGLAPNRYVARQGTRLHRAGHVYIEQEGETVWVGGHCVSCITGSVGL